MGIFWRSVKNSVQFPCNFQDTKRAASVCFSTTCGFLSAVRGGFEPPVRLPVRQFSKLVVSATHPSHQADPFEWTGLQIYKHFAESTKNLIRLSTKTGKIMDNPFIFHDLSIKRGTFMDKTQLEMQLSIKSGIFMDKVCRKCKFSTKTRVFMENLWRWTTA